MSRTYRLVVSCPDRIGIVAAVSGFLAEHGAWILEASQHSDAAKGWFFMRYEIRADSLPFDIEALRQAFTAIAERFDMNWQINDTDKPKQVVLMASRLDHCLSDLLHRWRSIIGARPYHKAFERGVKLVGATCHYVTEELDAGPIIEQDVVRVSHDDDIDDLVRLGRDVEKLVLARGLRYHLEDRVLIHDNKTVVVN
ncbi:MAG: formyltransferase family protein [Gammaproteobacteria bacterium]